MTCNKCGKELEENVKICDACGEAVAETAKPKKNKKLIAIIAVVVAAIILVVSLGSGGEPTSFGVTLSEYVDKFNAVVDNHVKNDSGMPDDEYQDVKDKLKMNVDYFNSDEDGVYWASNGSLEYQIEVDENGYVSAIAFVFPNDCTASQYEQLGTMCKWHMETITANSDYEYHNDIMRTLINDGELVKDSISYRFDEIDTKYSFQIYYISEE